MFSESVRNNEICENSGLAGKRRRNCKIGTENPNWVPFENSKINKFEKKEAGRLVETNQTTNKNQNNTKQL
jgi:hypothetical protein